MAEGRVTLDCFCHTVVNGVSARINFIVHAGDGVILKPSRIMQIYINGEARQMPDEVMTVAEVIDVLDVETTDGMAIAVNEQVVPGSQWSKTRVDDGDDIEVIRATQGG